MSSSPRVSIPESLLKTIEEIKAAIGKHTDDEDIYTVLKDCNMDPNETTRKFLYLETFQEVKRKHQKKKMRDDNCRYSSHNNSNGGRQFNGRLENNSSSKDTWSWSASKSSTPVLDKGSNRGPATVASSVAPAHGLTSVNNGRSNHEFTSRSTTTKGTKSNISRKRPEKLKNIISGSNPGPTPAPTPTNLTPILSKSEIPVGKPSILGNSAGQLSSASDPVLDPSLNPRNHGAIQRETRSQNVRVVELEDDNCSKQAASELNVKLRKLHVSGRPPYVIFPNHLRIPEDYKSPLIFGTMDMFLEQNNDTGASNNASQTPQSSSPISDQPQSPPHVPVNSSPSQENLSSSDDLKFDQTKQEMLSPVGRSQQDSLLNPTSSPTEQGLEPQQGGNGNSMLTTVTTPLPTEPRAIAQSSAAVLPQMYPYIRPPYPNYMYNPYYSQFYMPPPQNVHPMLNHSEFARQPSAGNSVYMSTAAAVSASGAKYPDNLGSEFKEKNMSSNEDSQGNTIYNLPREQVMAYPPAQVGYNFPSVNHQNRSMSAPQSLHQFQPTGEPAVPPSSSYPQQYVGQLGLNQKLFNRNNT